ncbi:hypothetical protein LCGC14_1582580 [marine sediment metagenome]|uniref:Uncharacterized protein n=1 Tax=marine sediment metagenome TaxID=412755 RepID=A0A0F9LGK9_9ZZZZ
MKVNLNLIRDELRNQGRAHRELAKFISITPRTMVSIFKKNDCSIRQFEKMVEFISCSGKDISDFIVFDDRKYAETLREYIAIILDDLSRMRNQLRDQDILRKSLVDKEEIIKLLKEKID